MGYNERYKQASEQSNREKVAKYQSENRDKLNERSRVYTANNLEKVRKQKREHMRRVRALKKLELSS